MIAFLQRLLRDYLQGGTLLERLAKSQGWSGATPQQLLEARHLVEFMDPYNLKLQKDINVSAVARKVPIVSKLFQADTIYFQQREHYRVFLFAYQYAGDNTQKDILELLITFEKALSAEFQTEFCPPWPEPSVSPNARPVPSKVQVAGSQAKRWLDSLLSLEKLHEPFRRLPLFEPKILKLCDKGMRAHFDESLNLGQAQNLTQLVLEIADTLMSARDSGRLAFR